MRAPEKTVRPVPRMPGLMSFKGKKAQRLFARRGQRLAREPPGRGSGAQSYCTRAPWRRQAMEFATLTVGGP